MSSTTSNLINTSPTASITDTSIGQSHSSVSVANLPYGLEALNNLTEAVLIFAVVFGIVSIGSLMLSYYADVKFFQWLLSK